MSILKWIILYRQSVKLPTRELDSGGGFFFEDDEEEEKIKLEIQKEQGLLHSSLM